MKKNCFERRNALISRRPENEVYIHILHPVDNGTRHAKLIDIHLSNISCGTYYLPRYLISHFLLKRIMVNVLLQQ